jgi:hypothetical protein
MSSVDGGSEYVMNGNGRYNSTSIGDIKGVYMRSHHWQSCSRLHLGDSSARRMAKTYREIKSRRLPLTPNTGVSPRLGSLCWQARMNQDATNSRAMNHAGEDAFYDRLVDAAASQIAIKHEVRSANHEAARSNLVSPARANWRIHSRREHGNE